MSFQGGGSGCASSPAGLRPTPRAWPIGELAAGPEEVDLAGLANAAIGAAAHAKVTAVAAGGEGVVKAVMRERGGGRQLWLPSRRPRHLANPCLLQSGWHLPGPGLSPSCAVTPHASSRSSSAMAAAAAPPIGKGTCKGGWRRAAAAGGGGPWRSPRAVRHTARACTAAASAHAGRRGPARAPARARERAGPVQRPPRLGVPDRAAPGVCRAVGTVGEAVAPGAHPFLPDGSHSPTKGPARRVGILMCPQIAAPPPLPSRLQAMGCHRVSGRAATAAARVTLSSPRRRRRRRRRRRPPRRSPAALPPPRPWAARRAWPPPPPPGCGRPPQSLHSW